MGMVFLVNVLAILGSSGCSRPTAEVNQAGDGPVNQRREAGLPDRPPGDSPIRSDSPTAVESVIDMPPANDEAPKPIPEAVATTGPGGSRREVVLQRFITRHGRDNVVVIRVSHAGGLKPGELVKQLTQDLGEVHFFATRPSADAIMAIPHAGDIEDVVACIDWGTVTSSNPAERLILVDGRQNANSEPTVDGEQN